MSFYYRLPVLEKCLEKWLHSDFSLANAVKYRCLFLQISQINAYVTENSCQSIINSIDSSESNTTEILQNLQLGNRNRMINGHLNIYSIRNKIEMPSFMFSNNMNIIMISETKLDKYFPIN